MFQSGGAVGSALQGSVEISDCPTTLSAPLAAPPAEGPSNSGRGRGLPSRLSGPRPVGLARERENLLAAGFSPEVVATIQSARTPSTRVVYDGRWNAFLDWCEVQDPPLVAHLASAQKVLDFLQDRLDLGLAFSTLRGYLAAIDACHLGVEGGRLSKFPEVVQFMHVDHLRPVTRSLFQLGTCKWF